MCDTCRTLENKVNNAVREGNPEKARVMASLLTNHQKNFHAAQGLVLVTPELIAWPSGCKWIVETR